MCSVYVHLYICSISVYTHSHIGIRVSIYRYDTRMHIYICIIMTTWLVSSHLETLLIAEAKAATLGKEPLGPDEMRGTGNVLVISGCNTYRYM